MDKYLKESLTDGQIHKQINKALGLQMFKNIGYSSLNIQMICFNSKVLVFLPFS